MDHDFHAEWRNKRAKSKIGFAILLVLGGTFLLGFNLGLIPIEYKSIVLSWQMLLIALGVISLFKRQLAGGIILLSIGIFFLLPVLSTIFPDTFGNIPADIHLYWPVLLIIGGIAFLFGKSSCKSHRRRCFDYHKRWAKEGDENLRNEVDYITKEVMFSSSEHIVFSPDFRGGDLNALFGEIKLDLRKVAELDINNHLAANVMFGSIIIYLPEAWELNLKSSTLFGSIEDKRLRSGGVTNEKSVKLNLKCSCAFGSVEIR